MKGIHQPPRASHIIEQIYGRERVRDSECIKANKRTTQRDQIKSSMSEAEDTSIQWSLPRQKTYLPTKIYRDSPYQYIYPEKDRDRKEKLTQSHPSSLRINKPNRLNELQLTNKPNCRNESRRENIIPDEPNESHFKTNQSTRTSHVRLT